MTLQRTKTYIQHMDDLASKSHGRTHAMIEVVFMLQGRIPFHLEPRDFFNPPALHHLLEQTPMILPFRDNGHRLGLRHVVQPVATHLTSTHESLNKNHHGQGGFTNSCTAFQLELALEELFYGRLFYPHPHHSPSPLEHIPQTPTAGQGGKGSWPCHPLVEPVLGSHHL